MRTLKIFFAAIYAAYKAYGYYYHRAAGKKLLVKKPRFMKPGYFKGGII